MGNALLFHHPHLLRSGTTLCLGRTSPALSLSRTVWLYETDTLSFPVRSFQRNLLLFPPSLIPSSRPQPWLRAPAAMLCLLNRMERWAAWAGTAGQRARTHTVSSLVGLHVHTQETDSNSFVKKACRVQSQTLCRVFVDWGYESSELFH